MPPSTRRAAIIQRLPAFCASLKKKRRWALGRFVAEPHGSRFGGVRATAALELLRLAATIGGTALRRNPLRSFASKVLQSRKFQCSEPDSGSCKVRSVEIRSDLASPLRNALMKRGWRAEEVAVSRPRDMTPARTGLHRIRYEIDWER